MLQANQMMVEVAQHAPVESRESAAGRRSVVIIDSQREMLELLKYRLEREFADVLCAKDGSEGLELAVEYRPDLIILDEEAGEMSGHEVCRHLRAHARTSLIPIIMTSTKPDEVDRVLGLETGADDYVVKPFYVNELLARVRATFRRLTRQERLHVPVQHGEILIDPASHSVTVRGNRVALTATEFRILVYLSGRSPRVVSRDEIIDEALGKDVAILGRAVDVHVSTLRRKLGPAGDHIRTIRGFGYKLEDALA